MGGSWRSVLGLYGNRQVVLQQTSYHKTECGRTQTCRVQGIVQSCGSKLLPGTAE